MFCKFFFPFLPKQKLLAIYSVNIFRLVNVFTKLNFHLNQKTLSINNAKFKKNFAVGSCVAFNMDYPYDSTQFRSFFCLFRFWVEMLSAWVKTVSTDPNRKPNVCFIHSTGPVWLLWQHFWITFHVNDSFCTQRPDTTSNSTNHDKTFFSKFSDRLVRFRFTLKIHSSNNSR